jgi:RNA polymerase sigma factor (sigma-70 family)
MRIRAKIESAGDPTQQDDCALIAACLEGDSTAWEKLIHRYKRLIYSIPLKSGLSPDDAADIFQSICLKLLEKLSGLRNHEKLSSWLITTTTRECWRVTELRRRRGVRSAAADDDEDDLLNEVPAPGPLADEQRQLLEEQQAVRQAVEQLADRCRELITLLFYKKDEMSYVEIARRMKMPVSSIGPTRARCLEKLKKSLEGKI